MSRFTEEKRLHEIAVRLNRCDDSDAKLLAKNLLREIIELRKPLEQFAHKALREYSVDSTALHRITVREADLARAAELIFGVEDD